MRRPPPTAPSSAHRTDGRRPFPPPLALVVAAGLPRPADRPAARCRAVDDWDEVLRLARRHGVLTLCHRTLAGLPDGCVPPTVLAAFRKHQARDARRALALTAELLAVGRALADAGVETLPFKGPLLSQRLFDSPTTRAPGDLDLLIRPEHLTTAIGILGERGYLPRSPRFPVDERNRPTIQRVRADMEFHHPGKRLTIELHWRWHRNPWLMPFDPHRVWDGRGELRLAGHPVAAIEERELFIYLCVHGCRHLWSRLKWLADVAWWLDDPAGAPDWGALLRRADELGARTALLATLELLGRLTDLPLPERPPPTRRVRRMADRCQRRLAAPRAHRASPFRELAEGVWMEWQMCDSWRARLHGVVWARFLRPNDNDMETLLLPPRLAPLYFAIKPLLWLRRRVGGGGTGRPGRSDGSR